jgi:hypothetical protein
VIEAQASGCVVVTSAKAALNETVEHGRTGICIKGDPKSDQYRREFISTVCELLRNRPLLERFSGAARERAFEKYRWSTIASEWTTILGTRETIGSAHSSAENARLSPKRQCKCCCTGARSIGREPVSEKRG